MAKLIKLVDYAYIKEEVDIPQSVPDTDLDHKIYQAQETLRMLMGDEFYQNYAQTYQAGPLTGAYLTLYAYLKQYLAWQTYEYYARFANFKPTRAGFRVHTEENSVVATDAQMSFIVKFAVQKAQYYKTLLVDYLNGHSADFSLYNVSCGTNKLTGNGFHISAVKNKYRHDHDCKCGCGGHDRIPIW